MDRPKKHDDFMTYCGWLNLQNVKTLGSATTLPLMAVMFMTYFCLYHFEAEDMILLS
jgi:hypothetical protein